MKANATVTSVPIRKVSSRASRRVFQNGPGLGNVVGDIQALRWLAEKPLEHVHKVPSRPAESRAPRLGDRHVGGDSRRSEPCFPGERCCAMVAMMVFKQIRDAANRRRTPPAAISAGKKGQHEVIGQGGRERQDVIVHHVIGDTDDDLLAPRDACDPRTPRVAIGYWDE